MSISFVVLAGGIFSVYRVISRYRQTSEIDLLLERRMKFPDFRNSPMLTFVPEKNARARKFWNCADCKKQINPSHEYWYFESRDRGRVRFCQECHASRAEQQKRDRAEIDAWEREFAFVVAGFAVQIAASYRKAYGEHLGESESRAVAETRLRNKYARYGHYWRQGQSPSHPGT